MSPQAVDAAVHRCTSCGGWLYGLRPCVTCNTVWAYANPVVLQPVGEGFRTDFRVDSEAAKSLGQSANSDRGDRPSAREERHDAA